MPQQPNDWVDDITSSSNQIDDWQDDDSFKFHSQANLPDPPKTMLQKWDELTINQPMTHKPTEWADYLAEPMMQYGESGNSPLRTAALYGGAWLHNVGEGVSGLTTPLNVATLGAGEIAGLLGKSAVTLSKAGKAAEAARRMGQAETALTGSKILSAPQAVSGITRIRRGVNGGQDYEGPVDWTDIGTGLIEGVGGAFGMAGSLPKIGEAVATPKVDAHPVDIGPMPTVQPDLPFPTPKPEPAPLPYVRPNKPKVGESYQLPFEEGSVYPPQARGPGGRFAPAAPREAVPDVPLVAEPPRPVAPSTELMVLRRTPDPTEYAVLKQQGWESGGVSEDGYPQLIRKTSGGEPTAPPAVVQQTKPSEPTITASPTSPDDIVNFHEDKGFAIPNPSNTVISKLVKAGWKIAGKDESGQTLFKRFVSGDEGTFTPGAMWENLKKLLGREPTEEEMRVNMGRQAQPGETTGRIAEFPQDTSQPTIPDEAVGLEPRDIKYERHMDLQEVKSASTIEQVQDLIQRWRNIGSEAQDMAAQTNFEDQAAMSEMNHASDMLEELQNTADRVKREGRYAPPPPEYVDMMNRMNDTIDQTQGNIPSTEGLDPRMAKQVLEGPRNWNLNEPQVPVEQPNLPMPMELHQQNRLGEIDAARSIDPEFTPHEYPMAPAGDEFYQPKLKLRKPLPNLSPDAITFGEGRSIKRLSDDYVYNQLDALPHGEPGLEFNEAYVGNRGDKPNIYDLTYRDPKGVPIAYASATSHGVGKLVADKSRGLLYGKAVKAIAEKLAELGVTKPSGMYTDDTKNLIEGFKKLLSDETGAVDVEDVLGVPKKAWTKAQEQLSKMYGEEGKVREAYNLARGMMSGGDLSAALKQGAGLMYTKEWLKAWKPMVESLGSEKAFETHLNALRDRELFQRKVNTKTGDIIPSVAEKAGLKLSDLTHAANREEGAISNWAESGGMFGKDNVVQKAYQNTGGRFMRASNRAYTAFLNQLRADTFEKLMNSGRDMSVEAIETGSARPGMRVQQFDVPQAIDLNPYANPKFAKEIADFVNTATGKAPMKLATPLGELNLEVAARPLSDVLFSPRLIMSRLRQLSPSTYTQASPFVRKQYMKSMLSIAGAWGATGLAANAAGAEVSMDMDSADFGKIKIGNTRFDPSFGFTPYLVAAHRLWSGTKTSSATGQSQEFGSGFQAETQKDSAERFWANKLHPVIKFAYDMADASQYQPFHVGDRTIQSFVPMVVGDIIDLAKEDPSLLPMLAPVIAGMGTQTYDKGESKGQYIPSEYDWLATGGGIKDLMPWNWKAKQ